MDNDRKKRIEALIKERDKFLNEHPELQILQNAIDDLLEPLGNNYLLRSKILCEFIVKFLRDKWLPSINELKFAIKRALKEANKVKDEDILIDFFNKKVGNF